MLSRILDVTGLTEVDIMGGKAEGDVYVVKTWNRLTYRVPIRQVYLLEWHRKLWGQHLLADALGLRMIRESTPRPRWPESTLGLKSAAESLTGIPIYVDECPCQ